MGNVDSRYIQTAQAQAKDVVNYANAGLHKWGGTDYNKQDYEQGQRWSNSESGKVEKTVAAVGASVIAPALVPEIEGAALIGEGTNVLSRGKWLVNAGLRNVVSSSAYQLVDEGSIDPEQLAIDTALGYGLEGGIEGFRAARLNPDVRALSDAVAPVYKDVANLETRGLAVERAEDKVHAAYQIKTLAKILEKSPGSDAGDALRAWAKAAPEMHDVPFAYMQQPGILLEQTPLQQVVEVLTGKEVSPMATIAEMAGMISGIDLPPGLDTTFS